MLTLHTKNRSTHVEYHEKIARAKHSLFDIGVTNRLCQRGEIKERRELFGTVFEQFIMRLEFH